MEKIGSIIGRVVPSMNNGRAQVKTGPVCRTCKDGRVVVDIESLWCKIVDENLRAHSYVEFSRNGTLFVKVDSSCYLSVLKMKSGEIVAGLRKAGVKVTNVRFRM